MKDFGPKQSQNVPLSVRRFPSELEGLKQLVDRDTSEDLSTDGVGKKQLVLTWFPIEKAQGVAQIVKGHLEKIKFEHTNMLIDAHNACDALLDDRASVAKCCRSFRLIGNLAKLAVRDGDLNSEVRGELQEVITAYRDHSGVVYLKPDLSRSEALAQLPDDYKNRFAIISVKELRNLGGQLDTKIKKPVEEVFATFQTELVLENESFGEREFSDQASSPSKKLQILKKFETLAFIGIGVGAALTLADWARFGKDGCFIMFLSIAFICGSLAERYEIRDEQKRQSKSPENDPWG